MEALDDDDRQSGSGITVSSPPGSYGQLIPSHHNPVVIQDGMHASIPPALPPHLLNVILNKEVIDVNEPSLLQEPHHVSLNHLYALSIKVSARSLHKAYTEYIGQIALSVLRCFPTLFLCYHKRKPLP